MKQGIANECQYAYWVRHILEVMLLIAIMRIAVVRLTHATIDIDR